MRHSVTRQPIKIKRSGFSLVELIMVIGILLFLIATSAIVVRNVGNKGREKGTMATIVKINGLLNQRIQAYHKVIESSRSQKLLRTRMSSKRGELVTLTGNKKYRVLSDPVVEILVRKDLFRENFPQLPYENTLIDDLIDRTLDGTTAAPVRNSNANLSAEYLYFILTQHDAFGVSPVGEDAFNTSEVGDTDNDGLKEFIDGWGRPLRFYRWPTRLIHPFGSTTIRRDIAGVFFSGLPPAPTLNEADPLKVDPDDPLGRLISENTRTNGLMTPLFSESVDYRYITPPPPPTVPGEYAALGRFWMPLIVSAGEDGILGLYEPNDFTNNGVLAQPTSVPADEGIYDNLTNHNQRAGGR